MKIDRPKYIESLLSLMDNGRVKIITGARRSGKSYLLSELFKEKLLEMGVAEDHFIFIPLEESVNFPLHNPLELEKYVRSRIKDDSRYYLALDEVQNVFSIVNPILTEGKIVLAKDDDLHAIGYVQVALSLMKIKNLDVYLTGSNSRFLSRDIITDFRDRADEIHVLPLSFLEFSSVKKDDLNSLYEEYSSFGGMPLIASYKTQEEKEKYLSDLYSLTYKKDVLERYKLKQEDKLDSLSKVLASSIGSLVNPNKIANTFVSKNMGEISSDTISSYIKYLKEAYIISEVERYDLRGRKKIGALRKYYFSDLGIRNSFLGFLSPDEGHVMENIIYNELLYRGFSVQIGVINSKKKVDGIYKREELETDFVCKKGSRIYYIQSCYDLMSSETRERETRPLRLINDSFKKIIVTRTGGPIRHDEYGITYIGIIDFLTRADSLDL